MNRKFCRIIFLSAFALFIVACGGRANRPTAAQSTFTPSTPEPGKVPGQWGTTGTSRVEQIDFPIEPRQIGDQKIQWVGEKNLRAQWFKILAASPEAWKNSGYINHAKGEPPDNTYYLWRYDKPLPEGTRILIEGDFPHARLLSFQVCAPWNNKALVSSDGVGLPEIHLLDEDIVPDLGSVNPFLPGADRTTTQRHFHITFELRDGDPVALNPQAAVPPYRAPGNLRFGCTGMAEPGSNFGAAKTHGPVVYVRMYLPDNYDPFGGVEPPVLRLQLPGQDPVLAPVSRAMPINLRQFVQNYSLEQNPALANGLSVKEQEANEAIRQYARNGIAKGGTPGTFVSQIHQVFDNPDSTLRLYKDFQTAYLMSYFKDYMSDPTGCRTTLPNRYRAAFGQMGPNVSPPGNDEHTSDHHIFNTYLVGAANVGAGQLLVFHGKAPNTPHTLKGNPTMEPSDQLRYWNITLQTGTPTRLTPVVNITDEETVVDQNGYYTIVIGREEDRPANATTENGITWRTWSASSVLGINIRIASTSAQTWEHAPQLITWNEGDYCTPGKNPNAVRARMDEYYIEGRYLSKQAVEAIGKPIEIKPGTFDWTMSVDNRTRTYRVHIPPSFTLSQKSPLVIALHSGRDNGQGMKKLTGLSELADQKNFVAVYPDAIGIDQGSVYWNDGRVPDVDDVHFISALIDELQAKLGIDPKRVYVTGISNGASMTDRLAVELSNKIAAVAPVAGTIGTKTANTSNFARPVPMLYWHGTADPLAYYDGGSAGTYRGSSLAADDFVKWWAKKNGCAAQPQSVDLPDTSDDGTRVTRIAYSNCKENADVLFYRIVGGGHTWPGGWQWLPEQTVGKTSRDINASQVMWDFFAAHALK